GRQGSGRRRRQRRRTQLQNRSPRHHHRNLPPDRHRPRRQAGRISIDGSALEVKTTFFLQPFPSSGYLPGVPAPVLTFGEEGMQVGVCGATSAFLAGVADFWAALVSRKLGSFLTLLYMIASSVIVLGLAQSLWLAEANIGWDDVLLATGIAAAAVIGYL